MGGTENFTLFFLPTTIISLSQLVSFESHVVEIFFSFLSKCSCKQYIFGTVPSTALQVNPTMTTSIKEKPANVKKVLNCKLGSTSCGVCRMNYIMFVERIV